MKRTRTAICIEPQAGSSRSGSCSETSNSNSSKSTDMPRDDPQPSTSRCGIEAEDLDEEEEKPLSRLRNRKINLNRLSSSLTCPQVCQFQYCGVQLRDGDSLEWHYQGHIAQEIEKLKKIRVKKSATEQVELESIRSRRQVRNSALQKIKFHRERRLALARSRTTQDQTARPLECPVCDKNDETEEDFEGHVEACLRTAPPPPASDDGNGYESEVEDLDVDSTSGFETYTWAGQTRIRATSLVEGGLRGAGFMTITSADEDLELDIENVDEEPVGVAQYTDADVILSNSDLNPDSSSDPNSNSAEEERDLRRTLLQNLTEHLTDKTVVRQKDFDKKDDVDVTVDLSHVPDLNCDLKELVAKLVKENEELKKNSVCKICMDSVYNKPLVSLTCWHVHCEDCWLRALGTKKLCPQCKCIIQPKDLRRIYL